MHKIKGTFEISDKFYLNGRDIKIISGAIHYFRTVPEYWYDRLLKLKAMGCNTVETYVPWNLHNPKEGEYDFKGILDLEKFVTMAEELGLYLIFRPGPYICAEWEFGGHPAWLLKDKTMQFRTNHPSYMENVKKYLDVLIPKIVKNQITHGGNIIMVQIENEYGYLDNDKEYLKALRKIMVDNGIDVPFMTSDGPWDKKYLDGSLDFDEVLPTFNFGSDAKKHYEDIKDDLGNRPFMCMEFWIGWFDYWGGKHASRSALNVAKDLDDLLDIGHVNFYMFHGGTNFGFMNGSNDGIRDSKTSQRKLLPDVTSYDYDALLTEAGDITEKYLACKEVIKKYHKFDEIEVSNTKKKAYGKLQCLERVSLLSVIDDISTKVISDKPLTMEDLGQNTGYVLYRTNITKRQAKSVDLVGALDRINYILNNEIIETRYDSTIAMKMRVDFPNENNTFDLLVENCGRVNFNKYLFTQEKGIRGPILIDGEAVNDIAMYSLPMDDLSNLDFSKEYKKNTPSFSRFELSIDEAFDTFIDLDGFTKGFVMVNGFNIGRYYEVGPQKRLYIPGPILRKGKNDIIVFESDGKADDQITLCDEPKLG